MLRHDLSEEESSQTLKALIQGAEQAQMAAFLVLLRAKVSWAGVALSSAKRSVERGGVERLRARPQSCAQMGRAAGGALVGLGRGQGLSVCSLSRLVAGPLGRAARPASAERWRPGPACGCCRVVPTGRDP